MSDPASYPYATHLDIKFPALSLVDVPGLIKSVTDQWYNQTLCKVNDAVGRLGVMQGEYHWHHRGPIEAFDCPTAGHGEPQVGAIEQCRRHALAFGAENQSKALRHSTFIQFYSRTRHRRGDGEARLVQHRGDVLAHLRL